MDWIQPPAYHAPAPQAVLVQGFVLVPRSPSPGASAAPATAPAAPLNLTLRATNLAEGRAQALAEAARRGLPAPRIRGEGFADGMYVGVVEPGGFAIQPDAKLSGSGLPWDAGSQPAEGSAPARPRRPNWILVLPVEAGRPGHPAWGSAAPWSRAWLAPVRRGGTRLVSITGDADDRERVPDALLDAPDGSRTDAAMMGMARKYGAPAAAIVRLEQSRVRVWMWRSNGGDPEFAEAEGGTDPHETGLSLLLGLAGVDTGPDTNHVADSAPTAPTEPPEVDIETHPEYARDSGEGYAVVLSSHDPAAAEIVRRAVAALPGATVGRVVVDRDGADIALVFRGDREALAAALQANGLRVGP